MDVKLCSLKEMNRTYYAWHYFRAGGFYEALGSGSMWSANILTVKETGDFRCWALVELLKKKFFLIVFNLSFWFPNKDLWDEKDPKKVSSPRSWLSRRTLSSCNQSMPCQGEVMNESDEHEGPQVHALKPKGSSRQTQRFRVLRIVLLNHNSWPGRPCFYQDTSFQKHVQKKIMSCISWWLI